MSSDLHYLSLDEVARRLKARKLSSVEATRAILDRIETLDPKLKSYATVTPERALAGRRALDAETAAGTSRGRCTACRSRSRISATPRACRPPPAWRSIASNVPAQDATVVARLEAGGRGDPGQAADDRGRLSALHHPDDRAAAQSLERRLLDRRRRRRARAWRPRPASASPRSAPTPAGRSAFPATMNGLIGPQADLGPGEPRRRLSARRIARPCRPDVPQRARCGDRSWA